MRLKQWYQYWSTLYVSNIEKGVNGVVDLTTKVKRIGKNEWRFWIEQDAYKVKTTLVGNNSYHLSFAYVDYFDNEISSITDKHTPFSVMDGVAVVMKRLIEVEKPNRIEYVVINSKKKVDVFKRVSRYIMTKHKDIFGSYEVKTEKVNMRREMPDMPEEMGDVIGIRVLLSRKGGKNATTNT